MGLGDKRGLARVYILDSFLPDINQIRGATIPLHGDGGSIGDLGIVQFLWGSKGCRVESRAHDHHGILSKQCRRVLFLARLSVRFPQDSDVVAPTVAVARHGPRQDLFDLVRGMQRG